MKKSEIVIEILKAAEELREIVHEQQHIIEILLKERTPIEPPKPSPNQHN